MKKEIEILKEKNYEKCLKISMTFDRKDSRGYKKSFINFHE